MEKKNLTFQPPRKQRPKGDSTSVIDAFNEAHDMHTLWSSMDISRHSRTDICLQTQRPSSLGLSCLKDGRAFSHHASDPFGNHSFDCFELWLQFEHMGNTSKAVKEAAQMLNVTQEPDYDYDREAIEHGAKVANSILSKPSKTSDDPLDTVPEHLLSVPGVLQDVVNHLRHNCHQTSTSVSVVQAALAFGSSGNGSKVGH